MRLPAKHSAISGIARQKSEVGKMGIVNHKVIIDGREYETELASLTGAQVRAMTAIPAEFGLVVEGRGNEPDVEIGDYETIDLTVGPRLLFSRPPTSFG